ncbi:hypothetical protein J6590_041007 [Homalodisca vitripennis]|nr:hypothetical protein J6590_041007 [Homalodisca vitripennis]
MLCGDFGKDNELWFRCCSCAGWIHAACSASEYQEDTNNLINILMAKEVPNNWQCVQQLVDFLQQLVELELPAITPLMSKMVTCVLPWVQVDGVAPDALELITTVLQQCRNTDDNVYKAVCSSVEKNLQVSHQGYCVQVELCE